MRNVIRRKCYLHTLEILYKNCHNIDIKEPYDGVQFTHKRNADKKRKCYIVNTIGQCQLFTRMNNLLHPLSFLLFVLFDHC